MFSGSFQDPWEEPEDRAPSTPSGEPWRVLCSLGHLPVLWPMPLGVPLTLDSRESEGCLAGCEGAAWACFTGAARRPCVCVQGSS